MSKSRRRPQGSSKHSELLWPETVEPETVDHDESAEAEEIDRLLLSSLRYWEVERDLIEERTAANSCKEIGEDRRTAPAG